MPAASGLAALQRPVVPLYDRATRALATIVLCGAAAPLFGGGVYAVLAAAIGGMALLLVLESPVLREIRVPLAALAGTAGSLSASQFLQIDATAPLLGSLILLMPGFSATVATAELATGNLLSGMARIAGAAATLVQIGLGMAVATRLLGPSEVVGIDPAVPVVATIAATSLAFTVVLGARAQLGPWIALSVLVAWAGSTLGTAYLGPYPGAAAAAWLVGMTGSLWGRWHHKPAALLTVPGLLLLVPGSIGFRGVVSALTGDVVVGMDLLLQMGVTAFALATGLLAAGVPTNPRLSAPRTAGSLGTGPAGSPRSMPAPRDGSGGPAPVPQH